MICAIICPQESSSKNDTREYNLPAKMTLRIRQYSIVDFFLMQVCLNFAGTTHLLLQFLPPQVPAAALSPTSSNNAATVVGMKLKRV